MVDGIREEHPSFGVITLARVQGSTRLFGSDIRHLNFISLAISTAHLNRDINRDWVHSDDQIVEIWLSPVQLAEALFAMNTSGTPCTLRYYRDRNGEFVVGDPETMPRAADEETFKEEARAMMKEATDYLRDAQRELQAILDGSQPRKKDLEELKFKVMKAAQHMTSNLPYIEKQFVESLEHKLMRGKAELEAYVENKLRSIGLGHVVADAQKMFTTPNQTSEPS